MASKKFLSTFKLVAKVAFTTLLVYLVFQKIDFGKVTATIGRSEPLWLVAALILYACSQVVSSWRLHGLLNTLAIPVGFFFNLRLYQLGMFYNVFLPGGIGGDGYKIYLLRKKFGTTARLLLLTLLFDRASGLLAITLLAATATLFLPVLALPVYLPLIYIVVALAVFYGCWRWFFHGAVTYFPSAVMKALLVQSVQCVAMYCILRALNVTGSYLPYIFSFLLSTIATVIPVSVGGLGLREYVMVQLAPLLLLDEATAVSASFCFYLISTLAALPGLWFVYRDQSLSSRTK